MSALPASLPEGFAARLRTARELLDEHREAASEPLVTAAPELDRLLAGGLPRGALVELVGGRSSGRFSLLMQTLAATTRSGETAALVDLGDGLDPQLAAAMGIDLQRLLWARPRHLKEALIAAESILAAGLPLVVLDLGVPPVPGGRGGEAGWRRLAHAADAARAALLVGSPYRASGTAAREVVEARATGGVWGGGRHPRLLRGLAAELELVKSRRGEARSPGRDDERRAPLRLRLPATIHIDDGGGAGSHDDRHDSKRGSGQDNVVPLRARA